MQLRALCPTRRPDLGKRLGLSLSEIKSLVDMYDSPKDSSAQMKRFLLVLASHREMLEQQREDIEVKGFVIDTVRDIGKARITLLRLEPEPA